MRNLIAIITIYCCCYAFNTSAQTHADYSAKGAVIDTASKTRLDGATVTILNAKDSVLQKFTYTSKGNFNIGRLQQGKLLLVVTYPDFVDYSAEFTLDAANPQKNFGNIALTLKSRMLKDVIIKAKVVAMKVKGDTTEFNAAAYATQKNAKVDDLLKQLPGMRINQSGVILFQGEQVQKILVDGEEFFYDDPALITKNVRADMVSKIQVYNDKSEFAKQTGVDDGKKVKTINVVLREDKRNGVFGKADAGTGTDKRYADQVMANKFSPKEKMSVYGNLSNTGSAGLGGGDNDKYGGGFGGGYYGVGIPKSLDAGVHYDAKWNKDKQNINSTYKVASFGVDNVSSSISQNSLPDGFNRVSNSGNSHSDGFRQNFNTTFNTQLDSLASLRFSVNGGLNKGSNTNRSYSSTTRGNGVLQNTNETESNGDFNSKNFNGSLDYYQRLKKPGRAFSIAYNTNRYESTSNNYFTSNLRYYNDQGLLDSNKNTDQHKPSTSTYYSNNIYVSYIEPLAKGLFASGSYSRLEATNTSNQQSFNKSGSGAYDVIDPLYSNNYSTHNSTDGYTFSLNYNKNKVSVGGNVNISNTILKQTNVSIDSILTRKFVDVSPNAYFNYQLGKSEYVTLNYNGNTQQPDIFQIQPLRQNSDPLNITIGNPLLRPQYNNNFKFNYYLYRPTGDSGINIWAGYSNQIHAIVSNRTTDTAGNNVYQSSNLQGHAPSSWYFHFNTYNHYTKLDFLLYPGINLSGNTSFNYINGKLSESRSINYSPDVTLQKNASTYAYGFEFSYTYSKNSASLQSVANDTRGYDASFNFNTKLPFNFFIGSDGNYQFRAANQVFKQAYSRFLLKAYFGKKFLKEENLKFTITGNDLLNQNTGYNRTGDSNSFTESYNNVIRRFFMASVTWDFTKFKKAPVTDATPKD